MRILSLDFETANYSDPSICAMGMAVFEDKKFLKSIYQLICPPAGHDWFHKNFIAIHGIQRHDVSDAPEFPEVFALLKQEAVQAEYVVAHNMPFDRRKLEGTLRYYGVPLPLWPWQCTLKLSRCAWPQLANHRLDTVAMSLGHRFRHHHAEEDAVVAGFIFLAAQELIVVKG